VVDENAGVPRRDRPAGPELARVHEEFFRVRRDESDVDWAEASFVHLLRDDVRIDVVEQMLTDASEAIRDARVDPSEAFGPPEEWAREQVTDLRESGLDVFDDALMLDARQSVVAALGVAAGASLLLFANRILSLLPFAGSAADLTVGMSLMPLMLGALIMALIAVYTRASARYPFGAAVAVSALTLVAGSMAVAGVIVPLGKVGLRVDGLWALALVAAYGSAALAVARLWRPRPSDPGELTAPDVLNHGAPADDDWIGRARVALRRRGDLKERRIDTALEEASAHCREAGRSLAREFGSPEGYAQTLPRDPRTVPRRLSILYGTLAVIWAVLGLTYAFLNDDPSTWMLIVYAALTALTAARAIRYARRLRRAARQ
jgi:hypothetical protein